jgi:hypothetical protein
MKNLLVAVVAIPFLLAACSGDGTSGPVDDNQPPIARFTFTPAAPTVGEPVKFDGSASSDPDGTIDRLAWTIDGASPPPTDTLFSIASIYVFTSDGAHPVQLIAFDNDGAAATASQTLAIGTAPLLSYSPIAGEWSGWLQGDDYFFWVRVELVSGTVERGSVVGTVQYIDGSPDDEPACSTEWHALYTEDEPMTWTVRERITTNRALCHTDHDGILQLRPLGADSLAFDYEPFVGPDVASGALGPR